MLSGKKIVLGVTGSIAAYKAAFLTRLLVKNGASVQVIMTPQAADFITPLTLSTLSKNPVLSRFTASPDTGEWNNHVALGLEADALVIAPASANTLAKMALGNCDNLLLATWLSARCPVWVAPAMDLDMLRHPATQANLDKLKTYGTHLIQPGYGELASGLTGEGRMAEPEEILDTLIGFFSKKKTLSGKKVLVTAGPTYEAIDPVRFIGNHSTGKMGIALAEKALELGARVVLISGPSAQPSHPAIERISVSSAQDMLEACKAHFPDADITLMAAAVADYRPVQVADKKIKKSEATLQLSLEATTDILRYLGTQKKAGQTLVGFALETDNELENARKKLESKNLDAIVLNSLRDEGAGFGHDTNKITVLGKHNKIRKFELKSKQDAAADIWSFLLEEKP